jgi:hypothetical protein
MMSDSYCCQTVASNTERTEAEKPTKLQNAKNTVCTSDRGNTYTDQITPSAHLRSTYDGTA